ncbi:hypothetical protein C4D60_Mb05t29120 [Musa balbisiana]|uniref:Uncharacterized protein n=1 Tax=Musa balbisiana TaxID=52838 RepID=A0A4S8JZT8_MUSBA|nr:hypothetical protein C4D60_Mb05t29120 [Musa balbisiana]
MADPLLGSFAAAALLHAWLSLCVEDSSTYLNSTDNLRVTSPGNWLLGNATLDASTLRINQALMEKVSPQLLSWTAFTCYLGFNRGKDPFFHPVLGLISLKHLLHMLHCLEHCSTKFDGWIHGTAKVAVGKGGVREQPEVKLSQAIMGLFFVIFLRMADPLLGSFAAAALLHAWLSLCVEDSSTYLNSTDNLRVTSPGNWLLGNATLDASTLRINQALMEKGGTF